MPSLLRQGLPCHGQGGFTSPGRHLPVFTRNPRGSKAKAADPADIEGPAGPAAGAWFRPLVAPPPPTPSTPARQILLCGSSPRRLWRRICSSWNSFPISCITSIPAAMWGRACRPASTGLSPSWTTPFARIRLPRSCSRPCRERAARWAARLKSCKPSWNGVKLPEKMGGLPGYLPRLFRRLRYCGGSRRRTRAV